MINHYEIIAQRIRQETEELERIVNAAQRHWRSSKTSPDADAYINSVALNCHGFYSGLERIVELIATDIDGIKIGGEHWHVELLRQMTLDLPKIRPPILQKESSNRLDEFRRFRHLVRNIYTTNLVPDEVEKLVNALPTLWSQVSSQLATFTQYLDGLAHADE